MTASRPLFTGIHATDYNEARLLEFDGQDGKSSFSAIAASISLIFDRFMTGAHGLSGDN